MKTPSSPTAANTLELYISCAVVYMIFAVGRILPYDSEDIIKAFFGGIIFLLWTSYVITTKTKHRIATTIFAFGLTYAIAFALSGMSSEQPGYAFDKFQGGIASSCIACFGLANCYSKFGINKTHRAIIFCALIVLALTALYKSTAGFFDRNTRFLINGPIVFGWIAGMFCIMSFQLHAVTRANVYKVSGYLFLVAVFWTQSKGPVLALLITLLYLNSTLILRNWPKAIFITLVAAIAFAANIESIEESLSDTRFSVIMRVATGQLQESDDGSIGTRSELVDHAISQIEAHPIGGIGLGEFGHIGFKYPHNQHLEIATEMGIPIAILHLTFVCACFFASRGIFRSFIIFFFIAGLFSGDISYLRFLYTFALLGLISKHLPWRNASVNSSAGIARD